MAGRPQQPERLPGRPTLHGAYQRPTRSRRVRRARRRYVAWLAEDGEPTTREQLLMGPTADAMIRFSELNAHIDEQGGLIDAQGQPLGAAKIYISLLNCIRRNLETLGLRPEKSDKLPDLGSYLEQHGDEPDTDSTENGNDSATTALQNDADAETDTEAAVDQGGDESGTQEPGGAA